MDKIGQIVIRKSNLEQYLEKNIIMEYFPVFFLEIQGRESGLNFKINESDELNIGPSGIYSLDLSGTQGFIYSLVLTSAEDKMTSNYDENPIIAIINMLYKGVEF